MFAYVCSVGLARLCLLVVLLERAPRRLLDKRTFPSTINLNNCESNNVNGTIRF